MLPLYLCVSTVVVEGHSLSLRTLTLDLIRVIVSKYNIHVNNKSFSSVSVVRVPRRCRITTVVSRVQTESLHGRPRSGLPGVSPSFSLLVVREESTD